MYVEAIQTDEWVRHAVLNSAKIAARNAHRDNEVGTISVPNEFYIAQSP